GGGGGGGAGAGGALGGGRGARGGEGWGGGGGGGGRGPRRWISSRQVESLARPRARSAASECCSSSPPSIVTTAARVSDRVTPSSSKPRVVTSSILARCFAFSTNTIEDSEFARM